MSEGEIRARARKLPFTLSGSGSGTRLLCCGKPVGEEIRTEEVGQLASRLALIPVVREILKEAQRALGASSSLVVEGRDMGTVIFPDARFKFFLDASPKVRALRRMNDLKAMGRTVALAELEKQIRSRDERDRNRPVAPLRPAEDALCIDTSQMTMDEVLRTILGCIENFAKKLPVSPGDIPSLARIWQAVKDVRPLTHFITNIVIINDCANITLACGASPIMTDAPEEASQVTSISQALVLNTGTVCPRSALSMRLAGITARLAGLPVVLDPVGAGVSDIRNDTLHHLLRDVRPDIIKGNISEIRWLAEGSGAARGVDAREGDLTDASNIDAHVRLAMLLARRQDCVVVISGPADIVADADRAYAVNNGSPWMERISGAGCMAAAVTGSCAGASPGEPLLAALTAMTAMGIAGEKAEESLDEHEGTGTFKVRLLDAVSRLTPADIDAGRRVRRLT